MLDLDHFSERSHLIALKLLHFIPNISGALHYVNAPYKIGDRSAF
ncbi:MAG: hypothetical protein ACKPH1_05310 [Microcystis panniformis]|nr:hypothetical protein [Microcystis sp. LE19-338.1B]MCZ8358667.1 hypothetical protein [Microcystis sp. LE19-388.1G]